MKICRHCGADINDGAICCPICGNETEIPPQKRGYDSYYEDVRPIDTEEKTKKNVRSGQGMLIGLVLVGLLAVIGACIAILCFT